MSIGNCFLLFLVDVIAVACDNKKIDYENDIIYACEFTHTVGCNWFFTSKPLITLPGVVFGLYVNLTIINYINRFTKFSRYSCLPLNVLGSPLATA